MPKVFGCPLCRMNLSNLDAYILIGIEQEGKSLRQMEKEMQVWFGVKVSYETIRQHYRHIYEKRTKGEPDWNEILKELDSREDRNGPGLTSQDKKLEQILKH